MDIENKREMTEFAACLKVAADLYGRPPLSGAAVKAFALLLRDFSMAEVKRALEEHMGHSPYMPKPSDIRGILEGSEDDRAAAAWAQVIRAMGRWGYYDSVKFPDPAIHFAISQMGGWMHLCATLKDETIPFRKKDFAGYYAVGRRTREAIPAYLTGQHEAENRLHGHALPRQVWDVRTGQRVPEKELPALTSGKTAEIVRLTARSMEVPA